MRHDFRDFPGFQARRLWWRLIAGGFVVFACGAWAGEPEEKTVSRAVLEVAAFSEMATLAAAQDWVRLDTGYYVSLENLDDLAVAGGEPLYNFIGDGGGTPVLDPATGRFRGQRANLLYPFLLWKGPYVTYQPGRTDTENFFQYDRGTPLDPWGHPYFLYSPAGMVRPPFGISLEGWGDYFDRYAIVSYGPDGQHDGGDDLIYLFGTGITRLSLTSVRPLRLETGDVLTLKGYRLDTAGADVLLNGTPANAGILSREPDRILKRILPDDPLGEVVVSLRMGENDIPTSFTIHIEPYATRSRFWDLYGAAGGCGEKR